MSYREDLAVRDTVRVKHLRQRLLSSSVADSFRSLEYFKPRDHQFRGLLNFDRFLISLMPSTFETLERERFFRHPPQNGASVPILSEFVTPHIESFNALFDDSGLPLGDGDGKGLLSLALKDIGERVVFSGTGASGGEGGEKAWGTRMRSEFVAYTQPSSTLNGVNTSMDRTSHNSSADGFGQR